MVIGKTDAVIVAAGESRRMGGGKSKLLSPMGGIPLLAYPLASFQSSPEVCRMVVVCRNEDRAEIEALVQSYHFSKATGYLAPGGPARADSVFSGLKWLNQQDPPEWIIVQDGARPFVRESMIRESLNSASQTGASVVAIPVYDTIKEADERGLLIRTLDRSMLWRIQTPQTFRFSLLWNAYLNLDRGDWSKYTDDAKVLESQGVFASIVPGDRTNIKITTPEDVDWAEYLLKRNPELRAVFENNL